MRRNDYVLCVANTIGAPEEVIDMDDDFSIVIVNDDFKEPVVEMKWYTTAKKAVKAMKHRFEKDLKTVGKTMISSEYFPEYCYASILYMCDGKECTLSYTLS